MLNEGLSPAVAFREYAGHIMPVPMYVSWILNSLSPFDFRLTASVMLLLQALAAVGFLRLLVTKFGPRMGILPPLAVYLFTVFSIPISIWWAAAANQLPLQVVLVYGLAQHVTHLRTGRARHAYWAVAWIIAGLLCYEKVLLVIGAYAFVSLGYFAEGSPVERLRQVFRTYRLSTLMLVLVGIAYLAVYVPLGLTFSPSRANSDMVAPVVGNVVLRNWLTAIFGGPLRWAYADESAPRVTPRT